MFTYEQLSVKFVQEYERIGKLINDTVFKVQITNVMITNADFIATNFLEFLIQGYLNYKTELKTKGLTNLLDVETAIFVERNLKRRDWQRLKGANQLIQDWTTVVYNSEKDLTLNGKLIEKNFRHNKGSLININKIQKTRQFFDFDYTINDYQLPSNHFTRVGEVELIADVSLFLNRTFETKFKNYINLKLLQERKLKIEEIWGNDLF